MPNLGGQIRLRSLRCPPSISILAIAILGSILTVTPPDDASAVGREAIATRSTRLGRDHRLRFDPPRSHLDALAARAAADTTWFGGTDPATGTAIDDGVWDFEDGTLQGWISDDATDTGLWFRHRTRFDFAGDPVDCVIDGSASMWCGRHESEAVPECWPGGQGYGNGWEHHLRKTFVYQGTGFVTLAFDYFVDSETGFDFTYVYVVPETGGTPPYPLNTSVNPNDLGFGYSGSLNGSISNQNLGSPTSPAHDELLIDFLYLPDPGGEFEVDFNFDSDPLVSDGVDLSLGYLNSAFGPLGLDNISVIQSTGAEEDDFESGSEGWVASYDPPAGSFLSVQLLADLDPIPGICACPLSEPGNDYVIITADLSGGGEPHPDDQDELAISPPAFVGGANQFRNDRMIRWSHFAELPLTGEVSYRAAAHYFPWTCPETSIVGWTLEPAGPPDFIITSEPECRTLLVSLAAEIPPFGVDSMRVVFEIVADIDFASSYRSRQSNQSPYWDDVQLGITGSDFNAPFLALDLLYQDVFPDNDGEPANTPLYVTPWARADVHSFYDNNRADGDLTNATMGDSVVVMTGIAPETHVYLNFRVSPGPKMFREHPWYVNEYLGRADADGWAEVEMDTVQVSDISQPGRYASYVNESDANFVPPELGPNGKPASHNKIIEDDVLTPGSRVEYFFSSQYGSGPKATFPDTSGGFYLEFEVLPGYVTVGGIEQSPCVLYVDASNQGAQLAIERWGLGPYLGTITHDEGVRPNWDRYDYLAADTDICAPMAREQNGDNGMTKLQSLLYRTVLYNTGTSVHEGLRDADADLLINFLVNDDFGRTEVEKGLWLSGNGIATILDHPARANCNALLANFAKVTVPSASSYREQTGDESFCVKLDPSTPAHFPMSGAGTASYSSLRGNGCPGYLAFQVIQPLVPGLGNLEYENQDGGGQITQYASVSNDQFPALANYGVVLDAFSLHFLRTTPPNFTGDGPTACTDSLAITQRLFDVFDWFSVRVVPCNQVEVDVDDGPPAPAVARTALLANAPNPFNPRTTVRYQLAELAQVRIEIYDVGGRRIRTLVDALQTPDRYTITWDGTDDGGLNTGSGVFWARMTTSTGFSQSTKLVLLK